MNKVDVLIKINSVVDLTEDLVEKEDLKTASIERLNEIVQDIHTILTEINIENNVNIKSQEFCTETLLAQIDINVLVESIEKAKEIGHNLHGILNEAYNLENKVTVLDTIFSI